MTDDLKKKILAAETLVAVDDLYRPYRPKKQTRATKAKEKGLEPLANILLLQATSKSMEEEAQSFVDEAKGVVNAKEALAGAKDIIAIKHCFFHKCLCIWIVLYHCFIQRIDNLCIRSLYLNRKKLFFFPTIDRQHTIPCNLRQFLAKIIIQRH